MKYHAIARFVTVIIALTVCYSIALTVFIKKSKREKEQSEKATGKQDCFANCDCRKRK